MQGTNNESTDFFEHVHIPSHLGGSTDPSAALHPLPTTMLRVNASSNSTTAASTLPSQSAGNNTSSHNNAVMLMNRRPKINENNIKLIEKVIKRQNLTAHQDSRQHHANNNNISTLLHH
jgi:hypothetical protein